MTRYNPSPDRVAVRRLQRLESKAQPKARGNSLRSAIRESVGA